MLQHHGDPFRPGDPPPTADQFKDGAVCRIENGTTGEVVREFYCNGTPTTTTTVEASSTSVVRETCEPVREGGPCAEDSPGWDCSIDGNGVCGPESNVYVVTPSVPTTDVISPETTVQVPSRPSGELPRTGGDASGLVLVALVLVVLGVLLMVARRWAR